MPHQHSWDGWLDGDGRRTYYQDREGGTDITTAVVDVIQRMVPITDVSNALKLTTYLLPVSCIQRKGLEVICKDGGNDSGMV